MQNTINCNSWAASCLLQPCKYFSLVKFLPVPNSHLRTIKGPLGEGLGVRNTNCYSWAASYLLQLCKDFSLGKIPICSYQPDSHPRTIKDLRMKGWVCRKPSASCYSWAACCLQIFLLGQNSYLFLSYLKTMKDGLGMQNTNHYSWAASHLLPHKYSYQPHQVTWGRLQDLRMRGWVCRTPATVTVVLLVAFCILTALHPCLVTTKQRCMYTASVDIQNELRKATVTHFESQAAKSAVSLLKRGE